MTDTIPVYAQEHYSIQTTLRLDELFSEEGIYVEVIILNAAGQPMEVVYTSPSFNRKTLNNKYKKNGAVPAVNTPAGMSSGMNSILPAKS
ncbi:hypothetical protein ASL11_21475 [Paenibacillus sp. Soil750]|nr:hypothetical protein ASL11_21475 [Paenibacillus sp. Soil750]